LQLEKCSVKEERESDDAIFRYVNGKTSVDALLVFIVGKTYPPECVIARKVKQRKITKKNKNGYK
jgi:hypothetical protein